MQTFQSFGNWDLLGSLGEGGFGEVHHWRNKMTRNEIATKLLKSNLRLRADEIEILKRRWIQEYTWMKSLDIPYIVGAIDVDDNEFLKYLQQQSYMKMLPVIVMEYCNGGDLRNILQRVENINGLLEKEIRDILRTLRIAVEYLHHQCNIEHRDIKPENIVIHKNGDDKIYKLTDFGYARDIPEATIAQSVVGTRLYVAPEVIDPGKYTKTVDYWSVGVLAYEITCGLRPFIPHKDFRVILQTIIETPKPKQCIAITQCVNDPRSDRFNFEEKISAQNNCSPIFNEKIEKWLTLALDLNYRERGFEDGQLQFYKNLDTLLGIKILSVYSLTTCNFFYYDIESFQSMDTLCNDTKIPFNEMYLTLPPMHPKETLENIKSPCDFYVHEWLDTKNPDNPQAMLYVSNFKQSDYNAATCSVPEVVNVCNRMDTGEYEKVPIWLLEQFEREVHYLLSEHQKRLECHMKALYQRIIQTEHEIFIYGNTIENVHEATIFLSGRVRQFQRTVEIFGGQQNSELMTKAKNFSSDCFILRDNVATNVSKRYKSVLSHCKALSADEIFQKLPEDDIFELKHFRRHLIDIRLNKPSNSKRMSKCIEAFDKWNQGLMSFNRNRCLKKIHFELFTQFQIFQKCRSTICDIGKYIKEFEDRLDDATSNLQRILLHNDELSVKLNSLCINGPQSCNGHVLNSSTAHLIEDANNMMCSIQSVMEIDDIPLTVQNI